MTAARRALPKTFAVIPSHLSPPKYRIQNKIIFKTIATMTILDQVHLHSFTINTALIEAFKNPTNSAQKKLYQCSSIITPRLARIAMRVKTNKIPNLAAKVTDYFSKSR